jgi:hypothetical protein
MSAPIAHCLTQKVLLSHWSDGHDDIKATLNRATRYAFGFKGHKTEVAQGLNAPQVSSVQAHCPTARCSQYALLR